MTNDSQRGTAQAAEKRVALVVERDCGVQSLIKTLLERAGFRVLQASHARDALELCAREGPVALCVTEVELPDMTGVALMEHILRSYEGTSFVFIGSDAQEALLRSEPPAPLLAKPFHPSELLRLVKRAAA